MGMRLNTTFPSGRPRGVPRPGQDFERTEITPIQYDPNHPFKCNNFVYRLALPSGVVGSSCKFRQPGCVPIPIGAKEFIPRLSNSEAHGMHQETRVQNEVSMLTLASAALRHIEPHVDYPLPESIKGWGGVTFDDSGAIVSAPMVSVGAGPWSSLEESYRDRLKAALAKTDTNPTFRVGEQRASEGESTPPDNLLYDPATGRITALLDYDFSSIQHPAYEFFRSFATNGGQLCGWLDDNTLQGQEAELLRNAKLSGQFPSPLPTRTDSHDGGLAVDWELAQVWEEALQKLDVKRPSTIPGIDKLADADEVLGSLLPWRLANEDLLRMNQDEDTRAALKRIAEGHLISLLDHLGS
ncbi:hypothetical protein B0T26DRAFT_681813 [Lasiosphaeria miniovina]|uniref:Aminoglycoside phosphotransferase domain-containing protein n=1 Tax=Lasiosphaeria miniovina TaxID=1954250 RepID=A0AA40DFN6_9PEZI|nr:uncharacterized protein B0T26DRAFT_681813 [Lasiosphaeria miniovina]KAK0701689.1 hypothetical protein B0T26DRAFT_681813 [Lasiosphaeria miniovina]